jgi:DNA-binding PadR family transcriptional regulator
MQSDLIRNRELKKQPKEYFEMRHFLGEFEELVLLATKSLDDNAYGVSIGKMIEKVTTKRVSSGAVYTALDRLEKKNYLVSNIGNSIARRGGRAKKFFKLTGAAETILKDTKEVRGLLKNKMQNENKNKRMNEKIEKSQIRTKAIEYITTVAVGFPVGVYIGTNRSGGNEFQIMPIDEFKSNVEDFWDWHVENNEQWFETPIEAAADFVEKYHKFQKTKKNERN